jgi:hypothetical protein
MMKKKRMSSRMTLRMKREMKWKRSIRGQAKMQEVA